MRCVSRLGGEKSWCLEQVKFASMLGRGSVE